jgi:hypothetical protein
MIVVAAEERCLPIDENGIVIVKQRAGRVACRYQAIDSSSRILQTIESPMDEKKYGMFVACSDPVQNPLHVSVLEAVFGDGGPTDTAGRRMVRAFGLNQATRGDRKSVTVEIQGELRVSGLSREAGGCG